MGVASIAQGDSYIGGVAGSGTVTSVTFTGDGTVLNSTPSSAVTTSGTLTAALNTQTANKVLAGPTTGSAADPTFRSLVVADMPNNTTGIQFSEATGANGTTALTSYAPFNFTINAMNGAQTASGSITAAIQIAGTNVTGLSAVSITSTPANTSASALNTVTAGQRVTVVLSSNSTAIGVEFFLNITRTS